VGCVIDRASEIMGVKLERYHLTHRYKARTLKKKPKSA
jgi:hypothetical protein